MGLIIVDKPKFQVGIKTDYNLSKTLVIDTAVYNIICVKTDPFRDKLRILRK
jgi:hypothetical protein